MALITGNPRIYVIMDPEGKEIGQLQIRAEPGGHGEIALTLEPGARGRGYGTEALCEACRLAEEDPAIRRLVAHIRGDNPASQKAFLKAGFTSGGEVLYHELPCLEYIREV